MLAETTVGVLLVLLIAARNQMLVWESDGRRGFLAGELYEAGHTDTGRATRAGRRKLQARDLGEGTAVGA